MAETVTFRLKVEFDTEESCDDCGTTEEDWYYDCDNCHKHLCERCYGDLTLVVCKRCAQEVSLCRCLEEASGGTAVKQKPKTETLCSNPPHFWRIECEDLAQVGYCKKCGARKVMVPRPARDERIPVINKVAEANRERVLRG